MDLVRETDQGQVYRSVILTSGSATFTAHRNRKFERILISRIKKAREGKSSLDALRITMDDDVELTITEKQIKCEFGVYSTAEITVDITNEERNDLLDFLVEGY